MSLFVQLQQVWNALACAEDAGEFLPYADKCRVLGVEPPLNCRGYLPPQEQQITRFVALNLGRHLDNNAIEYAISAAQRLDAGLVLLQQPNGAPLIMVDAAKIRIGAAGLAWDIIELTPPWLDAIIAFLNHRSNVVCLILGPHDLNPQAPLPTVFGHKTSSWSFTTPVVVVQPGVSLPQAV